MLVESICIVLILAIMVFVFMRGGRKDYALAVVPLLIVPFVHMLSSLVQDVLKIALSTNVKAAADVVGLAIAMAMIGLISGKMETKKSRMAYLIISGGFTAVLTIMFVMNYYSYLLK